VRSHGAPHAELAGRASRRVRAGADAMKQHVTVRTGRGNTRCLD
jgi:hypothetical protein